jgi:hypothetical protein
VIESDHRLVIRVEIPTESLIYEGEVPLADQQSLQLNSILGDKAAKVTVGRDMTTKHFGEGGGVFVSVTLTCDQSDPMVDYAIKAAGIIAQKHCHEQFEEHKKLLNYHGLGKPQ